MSADLSPLIAATSQWLTLSYPSAGSALDSALAEVQARQAVTVAAWLCYPTAVDAELAAMAGSGGSARLDRVTGAEPVGEDEEGLGLAWRTWVDEVVASWATCLLSDPALAEGAVAAVTAGEHAGGLPLDFRRLLAPDPRDVRAAALLRHPDLVAPVADLHRARLLDHLGLDETLPA
ncbi:MULTISPECIES: hypothetical protein [unclassified Streptomyces]|uniref:hypothetical protein n=1 Tax=unclassified Streptomyces TaxID=2593676 RepID=UPI0004BFB408|nr:MULTISPECIES: hypothetical protein [unclassified Streptomyces]